MSINFRDHWFNHAIKEVIDDIYNKVRIADGQAIDLLDTFLEALKAYYRDERRRD